MLRALLLSGLAAGLFACGEDEADVVGGTAFDPAPLFAPGPFAVGYREAEVTYRPAGLARDRTLPLEIWYPAVAGTGTDTTYRVAGFVEVAREAVRTNADLAPGDALPVLVYSHGNSGVGLAGFSYGELFASHGWLVIAVDHTGNTVTDSSNAVVFDLLTRPQDVSAALDFLADAPAPFTGRASDRVLAVGHSFGAYTVLTAAGAGRDLAALRASCAAPNDGSCELLDEEAVLAAFTAGVRDDRIDAVVAQAGPGTGFAEGALASIDVPVLAMAARLDDTVAFDPNAELVWSGLDGEDDLRVDLREGGHYSFLQICTYLDLELLAAVGLETRTDGCGEGFTPVPEIAPVVEAYTLAWGKWRVLGEAEWEPIRLSPLHPTVELAGR